MRLFLLFFLFVFSNLLMSQSTINATKTSANKWSYVIAYLGSKYGANHEEFKNEEKNRQLQLGIERTIISSSIGLSGMFLMSYNSFKTSGGYSTKLTMYNRKMEEVHLKGIMGLRLELSPKRIISPYISSGPVISIPSKYERSLTVADPNAPLNGLPAEQLIKAKLSNEMGVFFAFGAKINLSERTKLLLAFQIETFFSKINLSDLSSEIRLSGLGGEQKITPNCAFFGISLTRTFANNL